MTNWRAYHAKTKFGPNGCLLWIGGRTDRNYGSFNLGGKTVAAHRLAWRLANGPIPPGRFVLHRCDNPPCVNPKHLFIGTHRDNMRDLREKRDAGILPLVPVGVRSRKDTRLSVEAVRAFRREFIAAPPKERASVAARWADQFGVKPHYMATVGYCRHRWRTAN